MGPPGGSSLEGVQYKGTWSGSPIGGPEVGVTWRLSPGRDRRNHMEWVSWWVFCRGAPGEGYLDGVPCRVR